ncbi:acyltransferase [bacterium]|nr:acyltransferase [bacterium]
MQTLKYQNTQLKSLTGLRFLAALAVFIAHVSGQWPEYDFGKAPIGAAGVSFFFVLSGFILAYVYVPRLEASTSNKFPFKEFYLRRVARVWPLHLMTLLIALFAVFGWQIFQKQDHVLLKSFANVFLLQAWIPIHKWGYFLNGPAWSLSVEAFFYAVFPWFLIGWPKRFVFKYLSVLLFTILLVFLIGVYGPAWQSRGIQFDALIRNLPPMRCFEFASGIACGIFFLSRSQRSEHSPAFDTVVELFSVLLIVIFFYSSNRLGLYRHDQPPGISAGFNYWYRFSGAAPVFVILIFIFARSQGWGALLLSSRLFVYLGEISYSFYMVHMSVLLMVARHDRIEGSWVTPLQIVCCLGLSIAVSSLLYHLVEVPFRKAIVARFDKKTPAPFVKTLVHALTNEIAVKKIVIISVLFLACWGGIQQTRFNLNSSKVADAIVAASSSEFKDVQFGGDAVLRGVRVTREENDGLQIEAVWKLNSDRREIRFLNLLSVENKILKRGSANQVVFSNLEPQETVIDRVKIERDDLKGVEKIAIGFFEKGRGFAEVNKGPRNAKMQILYIWSKDSQ